VAKRKQVKHGAEKNNINLTELRRDLSRLGHTLRFIIGPQDSEEANSDRSKRILQVLGQARENDIYHARLRAIAVKKQTTFPPSDALPHAVELFTIVRKIDQGFEETGRPHLATFRDDVLDELESIRSASRFQEHVAELCKGYKIAYERMGQLIENPPETD